MQDYTAQTLPSFNYTLYDNLSRIVEVGRLENSTAMSYAISRETPTLGTLTTWFGTATAQTEITQTNYDISLAGVGTMFGTVGQQNIRGRVASTVLFSAPSTYPPPSGTYDNAIHYSYDIHGNVQTCIKQNNNFNLGLTYPGSLRRTDYTYDLVSGNVNSVSYQAGAPDEFDHKYEYDADNRITKAYTSRNGLIWEKDAKYFYYPHGPLSRTEIGDKEVQGMDHAYTIQGWIKGVNSGTLNSTRDMGYDGEAHIPTTATNNLDFTFAKDIYGYNLDYYTGDYSSIKSFSSGYSFIPTSTGTSTMDAATKNLFNGNIARMTTAHCDVTLSPVPEQIRTFRYDQLNRIRQSNTFVDANVASTDNWNTTTDNGRWYEEFHYDFNGNIQTALRNGDLTGTYQQMDNLTYTYQSPSDNNKLSYVSNAGYPGTYATLAVANQSGSPANYKYYEDGELMHDDIEEIDSIKWTVYGKVSKVLRKNTSMRADLEFVYDAIGNRIVKIVKPRQIISGATTGVQPQSNWTYTYYERDAKGITLATYNRTFTGSSGHYGFQDHLKLVEHDVYGSSRLGIREGNSGDEWVTTFSGTCGTSAGSMFTAVSYDTPALFISGGPTNFTRTIGYKEYEASNHLGNVLEVFRDKRIPTCGGHGTIAYYQPSIVSFQDYYAFGGQMAGYYVASSGAYRYGFNGKEFDPETYNSDGNEYDYGARIYNPRLGKWLSVDPLSNKFPSESPYCFSGNIPIWFSDIDGKYKFPKYLESKYKDLYSTFAKYIEENVHDDVMKSPIIQAGLLKFSGGNLTAKKIDEATTWLSGPTIIISDAPDGNPAVLGYYRHETNTIYINTKLVVQLKNASNKDKQAALYGLYVTLMHETVHYGDYLDGQQTPGEIGVDFAQEVFTSQDGQADGKTVHAYDGLDVHDIPQAKKQMQINENDCKGELNPTVPKDEKKSKETKHEDKK